jgi:hypothetical protein
MAKKYICIILALLILVVGSVSAAEYNTSIEEKGFTSAYNVVSMIPSANSWPISYSYDQSAAAIGVAIYEQMLHQSKLMEKQNQMIYIQTCGNRHIDISDYQPVGMNNTQVINWCEQNKDILNGY